MTGKIGVIDIGSNSVRLMIRENGETLYKKIKITRLAEGLCGGNSVLNADAIERTAEAVSAFYGLAEAEGASKVYAFATAAVRRAENGKEFTDAVKASCGAEIDVIDGDTEAEIGYLGALGGCDGGIIDIGGASTEIIVVKGNVPVYCKSLDIGSVRVFTACGQNKTATEKFAESVISGYGDVPHTDFYGIGGTATAIAAIAQELDPYDPKKVDGYKLIKTQVKNIADKLFSMTVAERKKIKGLQPERAEVIAGGAWILYAVMDKIGAEYITVSEKDNLEGYLVKKGA